MRTISMHWMAGLLALGALLGCGAAEDEVLDEWETPVQDTLETNTTPGLPEGGACVARCSASNPDCTSGSVLVTGKIINGSCCSSTACYVCDSPDYYKCTSTKVIGLPPIGGPPLNTK